MNDVVQLFGSGTREGSGGPSPRDLARFPLNDLGNAMRLILLCGGRIDRDGNVDHTNAELLNVLGLGWFGFNGCFWDREFGEDLARKRAHDVAGEMPGLWEIFKENGFAAKDFWRFATDTGSAGKTSAMLTQAKSYLTVKIDVFDRDPLAINCRNGTLKLALVDGEFRVELKDHDPADRITRCTAVDYDPKAKAELFRKVAAESLPDKEERGYFQRLCGYAATGRVEEQAFFFCQGPGQDGKSTLLDACREAMGSYGEAVSPDTFLEGGMRTGADAAPDLIKLSGDTRFAVLSEPKRGSKLNEGLLKAWTSGSPISARDLHSKPINFRPKAKLIFECNSLPRARGDDEGIWRRVKFSLFRKKVPDEKRDKLIPDKLREHELPGVLNWLLEGVGDWLRRGALDEPEALRTFVDDFRRQSTPFGDWLMSRCVYGEAAAGQRELTGVLYKDFQDWSEEQGNDRVMSAKAFGDAMTDRQIMVMGKNAKGLKYRGPIRLKTLAEIAEEAAASTPAGVSASAGGDPSDHEYGGW